jgi:hypothetical protein
MSLLLIVDLRDMCKCLWHRAEGDVFLRSKKKKKESGTLGEDGEGKLGKTLVWKSWEIRDSLNAEASKTRLYLRCGHFRTGLSYCTLSHGAAVFSPS